MLDLQQLLQPFNPWWEDKTKAFDKLPEFHRPIFEDLKTDIHALPQIISLTGPRRVGKTTLLHQLIKDLIEQDINPRHIVYYSMDDPALLLNSPGEINTFIEEAMQLARKASEPFYFFLDEIQRLEGWELYLKKYYDLKYPVRFMISGSASSPIFKKSRESLLGRVKDHHLLPFSFREFVLYHLGGSGPMMAELLELDNIAVSVVESVIDSGSIITPVTIKIPSDELKLQIDSMLATYFHEGGFPEVWTLPNLVDKQDYLFNNQVRKVIDEDLVLAIDLRKPELLKKFYLSLLATPGAERNITEISNETGINKQQIEKYLPMLEMTDLLFQVPKFRSGSLNVRRGNVKFYLSDLALRNAVLRISPEALMANEATLGLYAENLVFLALKKKWSSALQIDYYREKNEEIDFIVHSGAGRYLPIEVKYRNVIPDMTLLRKFRMNYPKSSQPIVVTKNWDQFGSQGDIFYWPLPLFLIMFG
jgi:uncharacterized protein